jgi:voltage-gated potassium channel
MYGAVLRLLARRLRGPVNTAVVAVVVASAGYVVVEGWSWSDAVYMSVITMGQVGFNEVRTLTDAGRIWTMIVILSGFAVFVYSSASLTALFVSGEVSAVYREKRRDKMREHLKDHVIVVGFGRVGRAAVDAAVRGGRQCVVIDSDDQEQDAVDAAGAVFLCGDARDATVLRAAGASRAAALITALDDPSNAVVALTARTLSPTLRVVARASDSSWRDRMMRAGASHVVPVYESAGASLAATALDAEVLGVLPIAGSELRVEEVEVGSESQAEGLSLRELADQCHEVHVLGLREEGEMRRWHETDAPLRAGDVLVVMGKAVTLQRLMALVRHGSRPGSTS